MDGHIGLVQDHAGNIIRGVTSKLIMNLLLNIKNKLTNINPGLLIVILFLLTSGLLALTFVKNETPQEKTTSPTLTPTVEKFSYLPKETERMLEYVKKELPLSQSDTLIRRRLIAQVNNESGVLYETQDFLIEYVKTPDVFMVGVKTEDIESARKDATDWFLQQGISDQGVCRLPVVFYPQFVPLKKTPFNPLPIGC